MFGNVKVVRFTSTKTVTNMNTLITLFPIAGLLVIAMWFFYETKVYFAFINWLSKTFTRERIIDFFCNWTETINDHYELY